MQTVYAVFRNKRQLLSDLVDVRIAGDDEPVALPDRSFVAEINALVRPPREAGALCPPSRRNAGPTGRRDDRAGRCGDDRRGRGRDLEQEHRGPPARHGDVRGRPGRRWVPPRADHSVESAADVLFLAMDVRNYDWLVRQRGWSPERYQEWYVDTVAAALLAPLRAVYRIGTSRSSSGRAASRIMSRS